MPAAIPNPALKPFDRLIGAWTTVGRHPLLPGKILQGRASFEWIEGGAFLIMRTAMDKPIPEGIAIIGSDDAKGTFSMLYFDERGVSRNYDMTIDAASFTWSRTAPDLSQRMTCRIADDGRSMEAVGEMSRNGGPWELDLSVSYTRT